MAQARHYLDELDRNAGNFVAPTPPPPVGSPEHIHPCRAETPPCSLSMAQTRRFLDELIRTTGPGTAIPWETPTERYNRMNKPRYHVPHPLSRELLTGTVDPCDGAYALCPPELERIYDGLNEARRRGNQSRLERYQRSLRYYYYDHQP